MSDCVVPQLNIVQHSQKDKANWAVATDSPGRWLSLTCLSLPSSTCPGSLTLQPHPSPDVPRSASLPSFTNTLPLLGCPPGHLPQAQICQAVRRSALGLPTPASLPLCPPHPGMPGCPVLCMALDTPVPEHPSFPCVAAVGPWASADARRAGSSGTPAPCPHSTARVVAGGCRRRPAAL